jgi:aspartate aminotransferase-like enzyme
MADASGKCGGKALRLFTPGPVELSRAAGEGLGRPLVHHRSEAFEDLWRAFGRDLEAAFQAGGPVAVLTASATGAMEAVVSNLFGPGDRVLVAANGKFSRRWAEIAKAYGLEVARLDLAPGESPSADLVATEAGRDGRISAVLLTQCETSTGSLTDLRAVAQAVREVEVRQGRTILVASDSATSFLVDELRTEAWGLDAVVGASQKGLLAPPGLSFVTLSARARERSRQASWPRYYFDLSKYLDSERAPFTPAIPLVAAAAASLSAILELGLERVWRANRASAAGLGLVVEAAGFEQVPVLRSAAVVVFRVGDGGAGDLARVLARDHGISVAEGQDELAGKVLRVSGIAKPPRDIRFFAWGLEQSLATLGRSRAPAGTTDITAKLEAVLEDAKLWE